MGPDRHLGRHPSCGVAGYGDGAAGTTCVNRLSWDACPLSCQAHEPTAGSTSSFQSFVVAVLVLVQANVLAMLTKYLAVGPSDT